MSFEISWHVENHIIFMSVVGELKDEDVALINQTMNKLMDEARMRNSCIHCVIDFAKASNMPSLKALGRMSFPQHPCFGWAIFVGVKEMRVRVPMVLGFQMCKAKLMLFGHISEAIEFLTDVDSNLRGYMISYVS